MDKYVRTKDGKVYKVIHINSVGPTKYVCVGDPYDFTIRFGGETKDVSGHGIVFINEEIVKEVFESEEKPN